MMTDGTTPLRDRYSDARTLKRDMLAWYACDGNLADAHGGNHASVVVGTISFGADRFGTPGAALVLDGTAGLTMTGIDIHDRSFSIQFWTLNPQKWILAQGVGVDGHGLHIGAGTAGMRCDYWGNDLVAPLAAADVWTHWVMVHDVETQLKSTWRDGACVARTQSAPYSGTGAFTLGRHFSGGGFYTGSLGDIAFWSRALAKNEIAWLYGNGQGLTYAALTDGFGMTGRT